MGTDSLFPEGVFNKSAARFLKKGQSPNFRPSLRGIRARLKRAAARFNSIDEHPPGFAFEPILVIEPIARVFMKGLAIENDQAAEVFWQNGSAKFGLHLFSTVPDFLLSATKQARKIKTA